MQPSRISWVVLLALVGGALSGLLLFDHHGVGAAGAAVDAMCGPSEQSGCETVSTSRYSSIGNISLAAIGLVFYGSVVFLASLALVVGESLRSAAAGLAIALVGAGVVADLGLFGLQAFAIGAFCKLCLATYGVNLALFALLWPAMRQFGSAFATLLGGEGRHMFVVWALGSLVIMVSVVAVESALAENAEAQKGSILGTAAPVSSGDSGSGPSLEAELARVQAQLGELQETLDDPTKYQKYQETKALAQFASEQVQTLALDAIPFKGPDGAPIRVVEFSDFLCPYCKNLAAALSNYLPSSGERVAIFYKNYPLDLDCNPGLSRTLHEGACELALGAVCASEQDKFWPYHDRIFALQPHNAEVDDVVRIAASVGLEEGPMRACMESSSAKDNLAAQIAEAKRLEVNSTPTLFINGKRLAQIGSFLQAIESEAKRLGLE